MKYAVRAVPRWSIRVKLRRDSPTEVVSGGTVLNFNGKQFVRTRGRRYLTYAVAERDIVTFLLLNPKFTTKLEITIEQIKD